MLCDRNAWPEELVSGDVFRAEEEGPGDVSGEYPTVKHATVSDNYRCFGFFEKQVLLRE